MSDFGIANFSLFMIAAWKYSFKAIYKNNVLFKIFI